MDLFITGLLFGLGFIAAIAIAVSICAMAVLIVLFVSYLTTKVGKRKSGKETGNGSGAGR